MTSKMYLTLFADDMALSYASTCSSDIQNKLNADLESIAIWLNDNKLTLNVEKSKFTLIGTPGKLKKAGDIQLSVKNKLLGRVQSFKYLGVVLNEHLTWSDHIDYIRSKVSQRLGILRRIKHLLPVSTRIIYVNTMVIPIIEYASLVWGDKNNKVLMELLQILQNKAAKLVLDLPICFSGTESLKKLNWKNLYIRRAINRCLWMYDLIQNNDTCIITNNHSYNTRNKHLLRTAKSKLNKGLHTSYNSCLHDWNELSSDIKALPTKRHFKRVILNVLQ